MKSHSGLKQMCPAVCALPCQRRKFLEIGQLYMENRICPLISAQFSLKEGPKAIKALESRASVGKIIVNLV
jgi:NADPH:quinone reductase-like Zn-dependent oxidoreductase